ncbi:hypothetical protein GE061_010445, partial [Apolygus lucorum]
MSSQTLRNDLRLTPSPPPPPPPPRLSSTTARPSYPPSENRRDRCLPAHQKNRRLRHNQKSRPPNHSRCPHDKSCPYRGDGSAEAAPTVTLVLNSALQRELRGLLHSWVAHASDIFNHKRKHQSGPSPPTLPPYTPTPITDLRAASQRSTSPKPPPPKSRPNLRYNSSPPPLAQPPPPTQSGLPTPSPPLKIKITLYLY